MIFTCLLKKLLNMKKIIIFEYITLLHLPIIFFYIFKKYKIYYINTNLKLNNIIKKYDIKKIRLETIKSVTF